MNGLPSHCGLRQLAVGAVFSPAAAVRAAGVRAASTYRRYRKPQPELTQFPPGHGEQIWIFNHILTKQIVYSHSPVLRNNRALKQLPFNGKKTKPAKIRKDYWKPMALVQFEQGAGKVGQSVFQKLREFRRLHELSWGAQAPELYKMDRKERGAALNDQRANSIADLAAVLAGAGQGNLIRLSRETQEEDKAAALAAEATPNSTAVAEPADAKKADKGKPEEKKDFYSTRGEGLAAATVFWEGEYDRDYARGWSSNVTHAIGIPTLKGMAEA